MSSIFSNSKSRVLDGTQQTFLDVVRIMAAYMVLLGHSFAYYQFTIFRDETYFPYIQNIGVIILFLISGFLNAYSLENKNFNMVYKFSSFFKHKVVRILRVYLPGIIFIVIIDGLYIIVNGDSYSYFGAYNIKQFVGNILFLQGTFVGNYLGIVPFGSGRPLWTLAIEWWLYLLFGFVYLVIVNRKKVGIGRGVLFVVLLVQPIDYLIGGRGAGLGFVFFLGVLAFYCYDLLSHRLSYIVFPISLILYVGYSYMYKEAYTIYSFTILWVSLCSGCKLFRGEEKEERFSYLYHKVHLS